jgi:hypothetical protein
MQFPDPEGVAAKLGCEPSGFDGPVAGLITGGVATLNRRLIAETPAGVIRYKISSVNAAITCIILATGRVREGRIHCVARPEMLLTGMLMCGKNQFIKCDAKCRRTSKSTEYHHVPKHHRTLSTLGDYFLKYPSNIDSSASQRHTDLDKQHRGHDQKNCFKHFLRHRPLRNYLVVHT